MLGIRRCGYALGAEVTGVDASLPVDDETMRLIRAALLEYAVICLPAQDLSPAQMSAFCSRFGELDLEHSNDVTRLLPGILERANKRMTPDGDRGRANRIAADLWHTDHTYTVNPGKITFLLGKDIPGVGGETMFANTCMAFETLSAKMQAIAQSLTGVHAKGFYAHESPTEKPPAMHPVVQTHPENGRKYLYVNDRVCRFAGMTDEESRPLLDFLKRHATGYEFIYRHRWTVNDLLVMDNRGSMHFAVQDYDPSQLRRLWRAAIAGPVTGKVEQPVPVA